MRPALLASFISITLWNSAAAQVTETLPRTREVDVQATDGGFVVTPEALPILPPTLVADSPAVYPDHLRGTEVAGTVRLELLISVDGDVEEVVLVTPLHADLDAAAITAAKALRFQPATQGEVPLPVRIHFDYVFDKVARPVKPAKLTGIVRADATRALIAGATLQVEGGLIAEADAKGRFSLELPPGTHWLRVSAPGHKARAFKEELEEGESLEVLYSIEPEQVNPYQTIVRDERPRTEVLRITLREQEIREVPGTQGDPFRVVMLMPGVAGVASGVSYPVVRGSQPAATGYFIDGVRVPMLFHLLLGPAVVHPDFIDGLDFHPGITPARYGRLLGGAIEGQVSRPRDDRTHASVYADLINAGGFVEVPVQSTGTNITLSGRYSYTPWMLALGSQWFTQPDLEGFRTRGVADFWDYQGRIEQKAGDGKLRLLAFGSSDVVGMDNMNPRGTDGYMFSRFHRADLRYRQAVGVGEAEVGFTWGTEQLGIEGRQGEELLGMYSLRTNNVVGRASWTAELGERFGLGIGVDIDHRRAASNITSGQREVERPGQGPSSAYRRPLTLATMSGVWAEAQWRVTDKLLIVPGARLDNYHLVPGIDHLAFDPRLTARYSLSDTWTIKGGAALLHQPPTVMVNLPVMDVGGLRYGLQEAWSVDLGAEWRPSSQLEVTLDTYYTRLTRAVEFDLDDVLNDVRRRGISLSDPGQPGYAYGVEVMARHPLGDRWFGWVSYSFQQSKRFHQFSRYDEDERIIGADSGWLPFAFEQEHVANLALSYKFPSNLTAGVVLHFNTGRPESGEISSRTMRKVTNAATGNERWVVTDKDDIDRLPSFFRADFRVSYARTFKDVTAEAYLDVLNVTLSREILGYQYVREPVSFHDANSPIVMKRKPMEIPVIVPILGGKVSW